MVLGGMQVGAVLAWLCPLQGIGGYFLKFGDVETDGVKWGTQAFSCHFDVAFF